MSEIEGLILIGGASIRMGADKAALQIRGKAFVEQIAATLQAITGRISVVGSEAKTSRWNLRGVPDVYPEWGALGGLHGALVACQAPWAAVIACDLPLVRAELWERLAPLRSGFDAVVPIQPDGRPQPLCALYSAKRCGRLAEELIKSGERRPKALLNRVRVRWVAASELTDIDGHELFFANVNTPEDYLRYIQPRNSG